MADYKESVGVQGGLYPLGEFPIAHAKDIEVSKGKRLSQILLEATGIDLSKFDSEGQIVETMADGSKVTTTLEFDTDGNPIKITVKDAAGNETVTTLAW